MRLFEGKCSLAHMAKMISNKILMDIFDFVEKFGSGNERPVPLPKMWNEEVGPPEWARQYLEEAKKKKKKMMMEKTRSDLPRLEEEEGSGEEKRRDLENGGEGGDEKEG